MRPAPATQSPAIPAPRRFAADVSLRSAAGELRKKYDALPRPLRRHTKQLARRLWPEFYQATGAFQQISFDLAAAPDQREGAKSKQVAKAEAKAKAQARQARAAAAIRQVIVEAETVNAVLADAVRVGGTSRLTWSAADIRDAAQAFADSIGKAVDATDAAALAEARLLLGVEVDVPGDTPAAQRKRLCDPKFWRRLIRKTVSRAAEKAHLRAGMVGEAGMHYVSDHAAKVKADSKAAMERWIKATTATAEDGTQIPLEQLTRTDKQKLAEFWTWAAAMQALAEEGRLEIAMLTLTLEPEWHPAPAKGKKSWSGKTPDLANRELADRWAQLRAALGQLGVALSGFRASEPHKDGCPHWHACLAYAPEARDQLLAEVVKLFPGKVALRTRTIDGDDLKTYFDDAAHVKTGGRPAAYANESHQSELAVINTKVSSVVTYVTKYVLKQTGDDRAGAWRSLWAIRGLQWFGIRNSLTAWRELRRLKECNETGLPRALWNAARNNDAKRYLELLGGLAAAPIDKDAPEVRRVTKAKAGVHIAERVNVETGEIMPAQVVGDTTAYGETARKTRGIALVQRVERKVRVETGELTKTGRRKVRTKTEVEFVVLSKIDTRLQDWTLKTETQKPIEAKAKNDVVAAQENRCITVIPNYPSKPCKTGISPELPEKILRRGQSLSTDERCGLGFCADETKKPHSRGLGRSPICIILEPAAASIISRY